MSKVKLSLRIRPNSEAAAWVVDEIVLLEQRIDEYIRLEEQLMRIYKSATTGEPLVSNQGQSLDGHSELANYRSILAELA